MTMPNERTRSLRWGHELLRELVDDPRTHPQDQEAASHLLKRYPSPATMRQWIASEARVLALPEATAISEAGDLFRSIRLGSRCPPDLSRSLERTLRHFPEAYELSHWSDARNSHSLVGEWLLPEDYYDRQNCYDPVGTRLASAVCASDIEAVLTDVFATPADATHWWSTPHPMLGSRSPCHAAETPDGAEKVRELLIKIRHGIVV